MGSTPFAALGIQGPAPHDHTKDFTDTSKQQLELKDLLLGRRAKQTQIDAAEMQIAEAKRAKEDEDLVRRAFADSDGTPDNARSLMQKYGVRPDTLMKMDQQLVQMRTALTQLDNAKLELGARQAARRAQIGMMIDPANPASLTQAMEQMATEGLADRATIQKQLQQYGQDPAGFAQLKTTLTKGSTFEQTELENELKRRQSKVADAQLVTEGVQQEQGRAQTENIKAQTERVKSGAADQPFDRIVAAKEKELGHKLTADEFIKLYTDVERAQKGSEPQTETELAIASVDERKTTADRQRAASALDALNTNRMERTTGGEMPDISGSTVDEQINSIPDPYDRSMVKALLEYRKSPQAVTSRSTAYNRWIKMANMIDPTFDEKLYGTRVNFLKQWTSTSTGAGANKIALNTAINHLGKFGEAAEALKNGDLQSQNRFTNWARTQLGDPKITTFKTALTALSGELATVFKKTGATDQEIEKWHSNISSNMSKRQLNASIETGVDLLAGRMDALVYSYEEAMGKKPPASVLSPAARGTIERFGFDPDSLKKKKAGGGAGGYTSRAKMPDGTEIGSNDNGETWYNVKTGAKVWGR